jgi:hypothetical protein
MRRRGIRFVAVRYIDIDATKLEVDLIVKVQMVSSGVPEDI